MNVIIAILVAIVIGLWVMVYILWDYNKHLHEQQKRLFSIILLHSKRLDIQTDIAKIQSNRLDNQYEYIKIVAGENDKGESKE